MSPNIYAPLSPTTLPPHFEILPPPYFILYYITFFLILPRRRIYSSSLLSVFPPFLLSYWLLTHFSMLLLSISQSWSFMFEIVRVPKKDSIIVILHYDWFYYNMIRELREACRGVMDKEGVVKVIKQLQFISEIMLQSYLKVGNHALI